MKALQTCKVSTKSTETNIEIYPNGVSDYEKSFDVLGVVAFTRVRTKKERRKFSLQPMAPPSKVVVA